MLNHTVEDFRYIARESLKRDMNKRGVPVSNLPNNFLDYEVDNNGFLKCNTTFGGKSDWIELCRYVRKLGVFVQFKNDGNAYLCLNDKFLNGDSIKKVSSRSYIVKAN